MDPLPRVIHDIASSSTIPAQKNSISAWSSQNEQERQYRRQRDAQFDSFFDKFSRSEEVIRQRFISFFKRGVLRRPSEKDYSLIRLGNEVAHHGNAYRDAHLYSTGSRTDSEVFEELYGFRPLKVLNIDRKFFPDPQ